MKNAMTSHPMCTPRRRLRTCGGLCRLGSLGALRAADIVKHLFEELRVYTQVAALAVWGAARGDLLAVLGVSLHGHLVQLRQMVEGNVRVRMMFNMPRHLPRELAVEPPSGCRSRAHPSVRVGVAAHQTGTVLGELIHAQVPGTEAVREQPIEDKWHACAERSYQRQETQKRVAQAIATRLDTNLPFRLLRLIDHPRILAISTGPPEHVGYPLEAKGITTQKSEVAAHRAGGVVQVEAAAAELGVLGRVVGEPMVGPVEAPHPHRAPEGDKAEELRKERVQPRGGESSVVDALVEGVEQEGHGDSIGHFREQQQQPIPTTVAPRDGAGAECQDTQVEGQLQKALCVAGV
mmetsp:Transcript_102578/g.294306  ORF Transcript_102578/g.294306 Transcript_102578/m.294306 type:complete len:349 (+) Transcript_102578:244-1290(+)